MRLKVKDLFIEAGGKFIVLLNKDDADDMGVRSLDRVLISSKGRSVTAILDTTTRAVKPGTVGAHSEVLKFFSLKDGENLDVSPAPEPASLNYIREKIRGIPLNRDRALSIVRDVTARSLSELEISAFLTAMDIRGITMDEVEALSRAMIQTGKRLSWGFNSPMLDKHNVGGIPGDQTTMLIVPIIAAAGYHIPKTSSRAITSPSGTSDTVEVLAPVSLPLDEIKRVVTKTKGCLVWGGAVELAPADDLFIQVEYPLSIDPLLLPSIMSKKKAAGSTHVVIDIPTGRNAKFATVADAKLIATKFVDLGRRLGMHVRCAITNGDQPLGLVAGPALEAREVLQCLKGKGPADYMDKATTLAGMLLEMVGEKNGKALAWKILKSGKAERKFREIIGEQGGDPKIRWQDIPVGDKVSVHAKKSGIVIGLDNKLIAAIARKAGAPKDKGAGIVMHAKIGDKVKKGQALLDIYYEKNYKRDEALALLEKANPYSVAEKLGSQMLIDGVPEKRAMLLDR